MKIYCSTESDQLQRFVGKDLFVRINLYYAGISRPSVYWLRFIEDTGDSYVVNSLGCDEVLMTEGYIPWVKDPWDKQRLLSEKHTIEKDRIKLIYPVQTLSVDEIFNSIIDENEFLSQLGEDDWVEAYVAEIPSRPHMVKILEDTGDSYICNHIDVTYCYHSHSLPWYKARELMNEIIEVPKSVFELKTPWETFKEDKLIELIADPTNV